MTKEELHAQDKCGNCGHADGVNTWDIDSPDTNPFFYAEDCECVEHISCKNCGVPL